MFFHHEFNKVIFCVQPLFEALALESRNTQHQLLAEKGFVCFCFCNSCARTLAPWDKCRVILDQPDSWQAVTLWTALLSQG